MKKILDTVIDIHPINWVILFTILQAFLYFQPYTHWTYGSFYYLAVDPQLFSHDIIKNSLLGTTTMFFKIMHFLLGDKITNPYYLFWPYLATCLIVVWAVFQLGKLISGGKNEVGLLMILLLLVHKTPVEGAFLTIIYSDYNYQHFTLPIIIFSLYFLLKRRFAAFAFLAAIAPYFHLKNSIVFILCIIPLLVYEVKKTPKILLNFILPTLLFLPRIIFLIRDLYLKSGFTLTEKIEYMNILIHREQIEGSMYFNLAGITNLIVYFLIAAVGISLTKYVVDEGLRKRVYLCHLGVFLTLLIGTVVRIVDHYFGPLGSIVILGYPRSTLIGVLLTISTVALFFDQKLNESLKSQQRMMLYVFLTILVFICTQDFYYTSLSDFLAKVLSVKTGTKLLFALATAGFILLALKLLQNNMSRKQMIHLLFIAIIGYVMVKGSFMTYRSYKSNYYYFPFNSVPGLFDSDFFDAKIWARDHTPKDALFLAVQNDGKVEKDFCCGGFRNVSLRSIWCQETTAMYGNAKIFREWKRRRNFLNEYRKLPLTQWDPLFDAEGIDYIVSTNGLLWPSNFIRVYRNNTYAIYKRSES